MGVSRVLALLPILLVIFGAVFLYISPWPGILRLTIQGQHVHVFPTRDTVVLPLLTLGFWAAALALSIRASRKLSKLPKETSR